MNQQVTELTIDARGAEAGSAVYLKAMQRAQQAVDRLIDSEAKQQASQDRQQAALTGGAASVGRIAAQWDRLRASADPAARVDIQARKAIERATLQADAAVKRGLATEQEAAAVVERVRERQIQSIRRLRRETAELAADQARAAQSSINATLGVRTDFGGGTRAADVAAYGAELDRLRARFNPLYGEISRYRLALGEIRQAHAVGAISADEMSQAIRRERQATLESIAALKGRRQALGESAFLRGSGFQTANLAAQVQDVAVTSAMGMNPLQIGLQQGMQMQMIMAGMDRREAIKTLSSAVTSLVTPVSLATIGLTAAAAAGIQYFSNIDRGAKKAQDALQEHTAAIGRIKAQYSEASAEAARYARESEGALLAAGRVNQRSLEATGRRENRSLLFSLGEEAVAGDPYSGFTRSFDVADEFAPFESAIQKLYAGIRSGNPDLDQFFESVDAIADTSPRLRRLGDEVYRIGDAARNINQALREQQRLLELASRPPDIEGMLRQQAFEVQQGIALQQEAFGVDLMELQARSPGQRAAAARARAALGGADDELASVRHNRIELAGKLELARAEHELAEAQRQRRRSLEQTIAAQQLEIELLGRTAGEAAELRMIFHETAQLREDAAQRGIRVDQAELAMIREKAAAYGALEDQLARARLMDDLRFDRDQMSRLPIDQEIAGTLRGAGLAVDMGSEEAGFLRGNIQMREAIDLTRELASTIGQDLWGAIRQGKVEWEDLGQIALSVLDRIGSKAIDAGVDLLVSGLFPGSGGRPTFTRAREYAFGGIVHGPGGPWGDGINARLSDGEFVVNSEATRRNRGLLEFINAGGLRMAGGGAVSSGGAGGDQIVKIYPPAGHEAEATQRTSGNDRIMDVFIKKVGQEYGLKRPVTRT